MADTRIDRLLQQFRPATGAKADATKTAAAAAPAAPATQSPAQAALTAAIAEAAAPATTKVASEVPVGPADALRKLAADAEELGNALQERRAALMGSIFADAVVARLGHAEKTAAARVETGVPFSKFASEHKVAAQDAFAQGYESTKAHLQKLAAESYQAGWQKALGEIQYKVANEFYKAAQLTMMVVRDAQGQ